MSFFFKRRQDTQTLSAYLGRQITLAITDLHGHDNKPEISLFIGILREMDGKYSIVADNGRMFGIPRAWFSKIKLMDEKVKSLLGNSDFLLPVTKPDAEAAGFTYRRDPNGDVDIQVRR